MTIEQELEIVDKAKSNVQDFAKLYDYYFSKILAYSINRVVSKEVAEDITSTVFLKAVENIAKFDTSKNIRFGSWLYRTAHNTIIDFFRKNKTYFSDSIFDSIQGTDNVEKLVEDDENRKTIALCISKLNPRYQNIISLSFFLELDTVEIADTIKIKRSNVHTLLHRALKAFRKEYEQIQKKK